MNEITINGKKLTEKQMQLPLDGSVSISYARLLLDAGESPQATRTVVYSLPDGRSGELMQNESAPLIAGAVYNVANTGNA